MGAIDIDLLHLHNGGYAVMVDDNFDFGIMDLDQNMLAEWNGYEEYEEGPEGPVTQQARDAAAWRTANPYDFVLADHGGPEVREKLMAIVRRFRGLWVRVCSMAAYNQGDAEQQQKSS